MDWTPLQWLEIAAKERHLPALKPTDVLRAIKVGSRVGLTDRPPSKVSEQPDCRVLN